jgi:hypothetical protein
MTVSHNSGLPAAWTQVLERRAPAVAQAFLADAHRYLADGGPERVPPGREAETLKNLVFAYMEPGQHDAVLYDLAVAALHQATPKPASVAGLVALGGAVVAGLALARRRRLKPLAHASKP